MEHATQFPEQYSKVSSVQKKVGIGPLGQQHDSDAPKQHICSTHSEPQWRVQPLQRTACRVALQHVQLGTVITMSRAAPPKSCYADGAHTTVLCWPRLLRTHTYKHRLTRSRTS